LNMDIEEIIKTIHSGVPGIHIKARDLLQVDEYIDSIKHQLDFKILEWNLGYGWVDFKNKRSLILDKEVSFFDDLQRIADADPNKKIFVIKNAFSALKSDIRAVARLQQELLRIKRYFCGKSAILLVANEDISFPDLSTLIVSFNCLPLASDAVNQVLTDFLKTKSIQVSTDVKNKLVSICSGMEKDLVVRVLKTLQNSYGNFFSEDAVAEALAIKKKYLSQFGLIELIDSTISIDQIGGLDQLKNWLRKKKQIFDDLTIAKQWGICPPKGILLVGMPGCGKSMSAKASASLFSVPLLRLDIGSLMGKFVGESESNMKESLKIAEAASPCVLWIDELEKAFSGINGSGGSTEITTRLFGYFLTWMQEKPGAVFVVATANDITTLPPELLRRGRFDEIFYIDLPNLHERKQIFKVHVECLPHPPHNLSYDELADKTEGFSGADIEAVIQDSLEEKFRKRESTLTNEILKKYIERINPISKVLEEKIGNYRELFAQYKLVSASFDENNCKKLNNYYKSSDPSERENAASNKLTKPEVLQILAEDDEEKVRKAVINNPNCPAIVLNNIVNNYKPVNFSKRGWLWEENKITKEEFLLALKHPNLAGSIIIDLYTEKKISQSELLSIADKLSKEEMESVFSKANVKLPRSIRLGIVKNIYCSVGDVVKPEDTVIEIDDEYGRTQSVTASLPGKVTKICTHIGDKISSGGLLMKISIPKDLP